jgi:hypothetical protein
MRNKNGGACGPAIFMKVLPRPALVDRIQGDSGGFQLLNFDDGNLFHDGSNSSLRLTSNWTLTYPKRILNMLICRVNIIFKKLRM